MAEEQFQEQLKENNQNVQVGAVDPNNSTSASGAGTASVSGAAASANVPPAAPKKKAEDVSLKYRGLSYELAVELDHYEGEYFTWDLPVPFGEKLMLYPVTVRDYDKFMDAVSCFLLDKKQLPPNSKPEDIKRQLKMTELEYLISKMELPEWRNRLAELVKLVFHVESGVKCPHCGHVMTFQEYQIAFTEVVKKMMEELASEKKKAEEAKEEVKEEKENKEEIEEDKEVKSEVENNDNENEEGEENKQKTPVVLCPECHGDGLFETIKYQENEQTHKIELYIDGQLIDFKNFNRLRNIVLFQNLPDYRDTSYIDPALKRDYEQQKKLKAQKHANLTATLEKKLVALNIFKGAHNYEELSKMTVRKFLMEFSTMDDFISYIIGMLGRVCGLGGGPKEIEHWIYQEVQDVYADGGYISTDTMMEKVKSVS